MLGLTFMLERMSAFLFQSWEGWHTVQACITRCRCLQSRLDAHRSFKAGMSTTATRFGLDDWGKLEIGMKADLLFVEGNPTTNIEDSLNIKGVWRQGVRLGST